MDSIRSLALFALLVGCESVGEGGVARSPVVHDVDDRVDVYAETDPVLAAQARASVVAMIPRARLELVSSTYEVLATTDLEERLNLCPDEAFADQPTAAGCSGTLVDDDLVLTAGHCILPQGPYGTADCTTMQFVFDFLMSSSTTLETIDVDDVYSCRAVLAHALDSKVDYAVVQLDRPVVGRAPAPVRRVGGALAIGTELVEIGFPTGMPMKIDDGGRVLDPGPPSLAYFIASLDAFRGNSGSGVLDDAGAVVGIVARTSEADYWYDAASRCYRTAVEPESRGSLAVTYVDEALADLCDDQRYPSMRLCGLAPACGDGHCTANESSACPADCPMPICGDGICEPSDDASSCPYDCGATIRAGGFATGCGVVRSGRASRFAPLAMLVFALVVGRRRSHRRSLLPLVVLALATSASSVSAQPRIHPWGLRFVGTIEGHRDRAVLRNDVAQFGTASTSGFGGGTRIGADMGLGRWGGAEATAGAHFVDGYETGSFELALAPRLRLLFLPRHELYLRAPIGVAWQTTRYRDFVPSLLVGAGLGYRWQLTRVVDAFVELEASGRFGGPIDAYSAYAFGYPLHPSSPPDLRTSSLTFRIGLGLGRGYRPRCEPDVWHREGTPDE